MQAAEAPKISSLPTAAHQRITVVGSGLAGSECALQLAKLGYDVDLIEMRGSIDPSGNSKTTPAHKTAKSAELVCSNSFGSLAQTSAPGLLKWEAEQLGSMILNAGLQSSVPAGQALSMDRELFSQHVSDIISKTPNIRVIRKAVESLNDIPRPAVIATGPLTDEPLALDMKRHFGDDFLYFFDAIAPIVDVDSIDTTIAWKADRWDKGTKDYFNCPLNRREYLAFVEAIVDAKKTEFKEFEKSTPYFDGCMPIEEMASRGPLTLRFGPMSAKGLRDPRTGAMPYAAVQLRQDNREGTAFNIVGFQTKMTYSEQKRVFRLIPGLENAEFLKLGSVHRNLYINSPRLLNLDLSSKTDPLLFFAGQITGVEGYFESTCIGMMVARMLDAKLRGELKPDASNLAELTHVLPPRGTAFGSLLAAITDFERAEHFQPTNINFGMFPLRDQAESEGPMPENDRECQIGVTALSPFAEAETLASARDFVKSATMNSTTGNASQHPPPEVGNDKSTDSTTNQLPTLGNGPMGARVAKKSVKRLSKAEKRAAQAAQTRENFIAWAKATGFALKNISEVDAASERLRLIAEAAAIANDAATALAKTNGAVAAAIINKPAVTPKFTAPVNESSSAGI
jgi:methylenetetrahydrofolate--tRNA-(uracil-5-)-methyltransferase